MTCEVAVMNKRGIALAADSAVTLGNGKKIYHTAEKLFSLTPSIPVAIMTFGATDMMNVPWETVVKIYPQKLGSRRFDTLDQCAKDFPGLHRGRHLAVSSRGSEKSPRRRRAGCLVRSLPRQTVGTARREIEGSRKRQAC